MLAYYIHQLSPFLIEITPGIGLRWYGIAYISAFFCGWLVYRQLSRRGFADLPEKEVADFIAWWVVLGTILGGRIGYMVLYQMDTFIQNPLNLFKVWEGGMSAHGGMIGVLLSTYLFARRHRISWLNLGDNLVVTVPIGLFFGRCANFINGELYGRATSVSWAIQFPQELQVEPRLAAQALNQTSSFFPAGTGLNTIIDSLGHSPAVQEILSRILTPRHPSQLYEAFFEGLVLFLILWFLRTKLLLRNGILTGGFFVLYAIFRSAMECFREPDATLIGDLTRGQFFSIFLGLLGIGFIIYAYLFPSWPLRKKTINSK